MDLEDRLRQMFAAAARGMPRSPMSVEATLAAARRRRVIARAALAGAAAAAAAAAVVVAVSGPQEGSGRLPPAATAPRPAPAPEQATPSTAPGPQCSAAGLSDDLPDQDYLPGPVAGMRSDIVAAATRCDYRKLGKLALAGAEGFTYSFGDAGDPARYWRRLERAPLRRREKVLALLVETLRLEACNQPYQPQPGRELVLYAWPAAQCNDADDDDWAALEPLYGSKAIAAMRSGGSGFIGYRVGITEDGDWQFFVAGD